MRLMSETYVIVGGGHAGGRAAETLRTEGFAGRIVVVGREPVRPYMRPMLSKEYLRGDQSMDEGFLKPEGWYEEHGIELKPGCEAIKLSPHAAEIRLDSGERLRYDKLLLTTGALPRKLELPGEDLPGVYHLRTIADSDVLRAELRKGRRIVVIGAGWIGAEVAASARQKGCHVTLVGHSTYPVAHALGNQIGKVFKGLHEAHGVELVRGKVKGFAGSGTLEAVKLASKQIPCDAAVVAVGVTPEVSLAMDAGLDCPNGIPTNQFFQTALPNVFAAGDVAAVDHPFYGRPVRVEHWNNAQRQGALAARNLLGQRRAYTKLPYFFSDQYDVGIEYVGQHQDGDELVLRGDPASHQFTGFWHRDGQVAAGIVMNGAGPKMDLIEALIKSDRKVDPALLADPDRPVASLL